MASEREIVKWLVETFNGYETGKIENFIEKILRQKGYGRFEASEEAGQRAERVLSILLSLPSEDLPFYFSPTDYSRLVGKQRQRPTDSADLLKLRERLDLVSSVIQAMITCGWATFERLCARLLIATGALEAFVTGATDDGGIDIYGRVPILLQTPVLEAGLLRNVLLYEKMLFLSQCKCRDASSILGRPEIDQFHGAVDLCLGKYEENQRPPTKRVPGDYYKKREACLKIFFTTGEYSQDAKAAADAQDIVCIGGRQLAQLLISLGVGILLSENGSPYVSASELASWAV